MVADLLLVQQFGNVAGHDDQTRTGVDSSPSSLQLQSLFTKRDSLELYLPVPLPPQRDVLELALVRILVDPSKDGLTAILFRVTHPEREDGLIQQSLIDHVVERRRNLVDRDGIIGQSQNPIEFPKGERQTGLLGGLSEQLVLDNKVRDYECVLADETLDATGSILDSKLGPVLLVGGRSIRVVLGVELQDTHTRQPIPSTQPFPSIHQTHETGNRSACLSRNPQIRTTRIQDHLERLRGRSEGDRGVVLEV
jgi:hypothetical protein